ncbi:MAG: acyl-CoA dehydratase activase [Chloroflexota bacterium]
MIYAGIDIGSASSKVVLVSDGRVIASEVQPSGGSYGAAARRVVQAALAKAGLTEKDIAGAVATGLGASAVTIPAFQVSDVSCQGKGVNHLFPSVRTIIDIGGQSTKVARVDAQGKLLDFVVSEKCAAGSGRFLQIIARILGIGLEDIGPLALKSHHPVEFSTGCAVFAESETVSRIAEGAAKEDILAGVHRAIASKVEALVRRVRLEPDCAVTGGGARDIGLVRSVSEALHVELLVPEEPQITAALGAALIAAEKSAGHAAGARGQA